MKLAGVLSLVALVTATAIPMADSAVKPSVDTHSLDTANAAVPNINATLAETATALMVRDEPKKAKVLESDPLTYILPFHLRIFESCVLGAPFALVTYSNGNVVVKDQPMNHNQIIAIDHLAPAFSQPLQLGPYDYTNSKMIFRYERCKWNDAEWWKECGECRPQAWSAGPINCKDPNVQSREREMDCSFLLAKRPIVQNW